MGAITGLRRQPATLAREVDVIQSKHREIIKRGFMADFMISVDEDVAEILKIIAEHQKVAIEDFLREMLLEDIERIKQRMHDPIIGALGGFGTAEDDVAERADDILHEEWQPR